MKKLILTICILISFAGCKKNGDASMPDKDYLSVLKEKGWSVSFSTPGNPTQYLFFRFKADGTILSSETYADNTSYTWKLDGKHLSLQMAGTMLEGDIT